MTFESEATPISASDSAMSHDSRIRLVLQRLSLGFYERRDVLREVAATILKRGEM